MKNKKLWAHYGQVTMIFGTYIALFFVVPFLSLCFSCLAHSSEIDAHVQDAVKTAILSGLKWYAIIMPIVTALFAIWFVCYSNRVEFTDTSILYFRFLRSKKSRSISYHEITECVFSDGLWKHSGDYVRGRKIFIYNKSKIILELELYDKLCLSIALILCDKKVRLVDDNDHLKTIDNYFKIDFMNLSADKQFKLLKYYCKSTHTKYKTGEEILRQKAK